MQVIAINDDCTEIFDNVDKIEEGSPNYLEIAGIDGVSADVLIAFSSNGLR